MPPRTGMVVWWMLNEVWVNVFDKGTEETWFGLLRAGSHMTEQPILMYPVCSLQGRILSKHHEWLTSIQSWICRQGACGSPGGSEQGDATCVTSQGVPCSWAGWGTDGCSGCFTNSWSTRTGEAWPWCWCWSHGWSETAGTGGSRRWDDLHHAKDRPWWSNPQFEGWTPGCHEPSRWRIENWGHGVWGAEEFSCGTDASTCSIQGNKYSHYPSGDGCWFIWRGTGGAWVDRSRARLCHGPDVCRSSATAAADSTACDIDGATAKATGEFGKTVGPAGLCSAAHVWNNEKAGPMQRRYNCCERETSEAEGHGDHDEETGPAHPAAPSAPVASIEWSKPCHWWWCLWDNHW